MGQLVATSRGEFYAEQRGPEGAQAVVFVAGLGDDHASWSDVVDILSSSYRCITFDNRGIGASVRTDGPYTTASMAADAEGVVAALGLGTVDAVGSSMGGAICQEWALARPDRIRRLVLSNTWGQRDAWFSALIEHWIDLVRRGASYDVLYQLALFCYSPEHLTVHPDTVAEFLGSEPPDSVGFVGAAQACQSHDASDRLPSLRQRALVIGGESDILTRPQLSQQLADRLPQATLEWLPAGHMIFWERPEAWAELVDAFLSSTSD